MSTRAYNVREDRLKIGCWEDAFNKRTNMVIVQLTRITRKEGQWGVITCNQRLLVPYSLVTSHVMVAHLQSKWSGDQYPSYHTLWPMTMPIQSKIHFVCIVYVTPLSQAQRCTRCTIVLTQHTQVVHCPVTSMGCICEHLIPEWYTVTHLPRL